MPSTNLWNHVLDQKILANPLRNYCAIGSVVHIIDLYRSSYTGRCLAVRADVRQCFGSNCLTCFVRLWFGYIVYWLDICQGFPVAQTSPCYNWCHTLDIMKMSHSFCSRVFDIGSNPGVTGSREVRFIFLWEVCHILELLTNLIHESDFLQRQVYTWKVLWRRRKRCTLKQPCLAHHVMHDKNYWAELGPALPMIEEEENHALYSVVADKAWLICFVHKIAKSKTQ